MNTKLYCNSLTEYSRYKTRVVTIGDVPLGGDNPIRIQSMTTTDTMNTLATVEQSIRMIDAGCEYVRITAPSLKEAQNLKNIKDELRKRGYTAPLIADIHFTPNAAELAARLVEKVRVNPGNYADKKKFETIEYSDYEYEAEMERIRERFTPLVKICKEYGTAMRIGTNHGSLSDRILGRYGDTPLGMVESALEFLRICEDSKYYNIVLSMKASNTQVMVQAYRLLILKMQELGMNYPLHLGVTEAGDGEDGRIKSAVGIGALLEDGIGDTIRVSLTEDPEFEIPVAKALVRRVESLKLESAKLADSQKSKNLSNPKLDKLKLNYNPYEYKRRETDEIANFGGHNVPRVIADYSQRDGIEAASLFSVGYQYSVPTDKWTITEQACDYVYVGDNVTRFEIPGTLGLIYNRRVWESLSNQSECYPLFTFEDFNKIKVRSDKLNFVTVTIDDILQLYHNIYSKKDIPFEEILNHEYKRCKLVLIFETSKEHGMAEQRRMFMELQKRKINVPVIIKRNYKKMKDEDFQLYAAADMGALLLDGFADGVMLSYQRPQNKGCDQRLINSTSFGLLQATRMRISKTEYISCPSCGRTLFDLQETTAKIRERTDHLKGVKIGIMGCIVNGPGEMADADYGYVGTGPGKITLYQGKQVVERNIDEDKAVDSLISLIKKGGDWVDA